MIKINCSNSVKSFIKYTNVLYIIKRGYGICLSFPVNKSPPKKIKKIFHILDVLNPKRMNRCGKEMSWSEWLVEGVFPTILYNENNKSLFSLLKDKRFSSKAIYSDINGYSSFFGRMARKRKYSSYGNFNGFLDLLLYRLKIKNIQSQPMYYFDVENPSWVLEHIFKNPNQLKTNRTSLSCVSNFSFNYVSKEDKLIMSMVLRHNEWSHIAGDIFGGEMIANSIIKELGIKNGVVNIFILSASITGAKINKIHVNKINKINQNKEQK